MKRFRSNLWFPISEKFSLGIVKVYLVKDLELSQILKYELLLGDKQWFKLGGIWWTSFYTKITLDLS